MIVTTWGDGDTGGIIILSTQGVKVGTDCHGCITDTPLTDRDEIRKLYHALGDYLMATAPNADH